MVNRIIWNITQLLRMIKGLKEDVVIDIGMNVQKKKKIPKKI